MSAGLVMALAGWGTAVLGGGFAVAAFAAERRRPRYVGRHRFRW